MILEGENTLDAFPSTDLQKTLQERGIKTVAFAGALSNHCIESTLRSAYDLGFEAIPLVDACVALDQAQHDAVAQHIWPTIAKPMTVADFTAALGAKAAA